MNLFYKKTLFMKDKFNEKLKWEISILLNKKL